MELHSCLLILLKFYFPGNAAILFVAHILLCNFVIIRYFYDSRVFIVPVFN